MNPQKHTWDTRAWLIGIIGGVFCAALSVACLDPWIAARLNTILLNGDYWTSEGLAALALLLLPAILSGIARHQTFFWGLVPMFVCWVGVSLAGAIYGNRGGYPSLWASLGFLGLCLLVSSGPVSLIRWQMARSKRRREAKLASNPAMREAASIPQEGVWPPPPNHNML